MSTLRRLKLLYREQVEEVRRDSTVHPTSLKLTSPTLKVEPAEVSFEPTVPQNISQTNSVSNAKPGTEESRTLSTSSSDVILSPPVEQPYRFRSISDVSHDTRVLTSYRTEGSVTASSSYEHSNEVRWTDILYIYCIILGYMVRWCGSFTTCLVRDFTVIYAVYCIYMCVVVGIAVGLL